MWQNFNNWWPGGVCPMCWAGIVVFVVIIIFLVVALINRGMLAGKAGREPASSPGKQILDERYAKGEIDKHQYEQMKKDIR